MLNPIEFIRQTRMETKKVSWPSRQETTISAIAVFVMVVISSLFLFGADQLIALIVRMIINLGA